MFILLRIYYIFLLTNENGEYDVEHVPLIASGHIWEGPKTRQITSDVD